MPVSAYVVNVDCVVVRDGRYLVIERSEDVEHAPGALGFPGGRLEAEPGDVNAIEATATRELEEEVGLSVSAVEFVHSSVFEADDGTTCLNVVCCSQSPEGEPQVAAPREVAALHWMVPDDLLARDDVPAYTKRDTERVQAFLRRREAAG